MTQRLCRVFVSKQTAKTFKNLAKQLFEILKSSQETKAELNPVIEKLSHTFEP